MTPLTTFHLFTQLPPELRSMIWDLNLKSLKARIIHARKLKERSKVQKGKYRFRYKVPPILQACRESRRWAQRLHEPSFSSARRGHGRKYPREYVWFNFDKDIVELNSSDLSSRMPQANRIKHLRILELIPRGKRQSNWDEQSTIDAEFWNKCRQLGQFIHLERLHIFTTVFEHMGREIKVHQMLKSKSKCGVRIFDAFIGWSRDAYGFRSIKRTEDWHCFGSLKWDFAAMALGVDIPLPMADEPVVLPNTNHLLGDC